MADLKNSRTDSESADVASMLFTQPKCLGISMTNRAKKNVEIGDIKVNVCLFAFDLMYLNGEPLLWNGLRSPVSRSTATTSPSRIKLDTPSPRICGTSETRSGYFSVMSSRSNRAKKNVEIGDIKVNVCLFAFDLMYLNGEPLLENLEWLKIASLTVHGNYFSL
jgi:hypothetical protein